MTISFSQICKQTVNSRWDLWNSGTFYEISMKAKNKGFTQKLNVNQTYCLCTKFNKINWNCISFHGAKNLKYRGQFQKSASKYFANLWKFYNIFGNIHSIYLILHWIFSYIITKMECSLKCMVFPRERRKTDTSSVSF